MARLTFVRRLELRLLLLVFAAAAALWAFLAIGGEMKEGETLALDRRLLLMLRQPGDPSQPIGSRSFQESMRDVTALGGVTVLTLVTIAVTLALVFHRKLRQAWIFLATVLIAQVASEQLKSLYGRPRPELVPHGSYVYSASFPSGHSMLSAAVYLTLAMIVASLEPRRPTKVLVFVLAVGMMIAIGFSRVYLAVHWPSDVLAGWCAGAGLAALAWTVMGWSGARTGRS
jgi:undecaprenyl-diphosphatase